jgi:hypothetical protein
MDEKYITKRIFQTDSFDVEELLQCSIDRFIYDFDDKVITYFVPKHNCTNMTGAIIYAKTIDPLVCSIYVFEDGNLINSYRKMNDKWVCQSYDRV